MTVSTQQCLSQLRRELERRSGTILKAASLSKIRFPHPTDDYLEVQVWWGKDPFETHTERFHYGDLYRDGPLGPQLKRRPCNITRCLIQNILIRRGV
jgi:hypothetical protein